MFEREQEPFSLFLVTRIHLVPLEYSRSARNMLHTPMNATPPRLFTGLTAFFSPQIPPSTRASWCHHGGQLATAETPYCVQMHFGSYGRQCELIERCVPFRVLAYHSTTLTLDSEQAQSYRDRRDTRKLDIRIDQAATTSQY